MALCLGDYAGGDWYFIAVCEACGRETALEPAEILARPGTEKVHRGMRVEDLEPLLRCRECRSQEGASRTSRQNSQARLHRRNDMKGEALFGNAGYVPPPE